MRSAPPPVALSIAGSDPSGGAGIQADLKTFSALGAYGTCVITALTAQATTGVTGVHAVPTDFVGLQLDTLLADVRIDAVKIGMLGTAALAETVGGYVRGGRFGDAPVVLDPVMVATSGSRLLDDDAVDAVRALFPHVSLITPNLAEAAVLTGRPPAESLEDMRAQADELAGQGAARVLLKGGHLGSEPDAVDLLLDESGEHLLRSERIATTNTHGTGCSLSSAIAALRPQLETWPLAVASAKPWLTEALRHADELDIGAGPGPVHHFHALWPH